MSTQWKVGDVIEKDYREHIVKEVHPIDEQTIVLEAMYWDEGHQEWRSEEIWIDEL